MLQKIRTKYSIIIIVSLFWFCADDTFAKYIDPGAKLTKITDNGKSTLLAWSPDGRKILYLYEISGSQKQLMVVNADGTNPQPISLVGSPIFAEWSYHSDKVAYIFSNADSLESQTQFYLYDINTNKTTTISPPYTQQDIDLDDGPIFSPDDKFIAYAVKPASADKRQLWIVEVGTGKRWQLLSDRGGIKDIHWSLALPYRIAMKLVSTNKFYDIATIDPYGKDLNLITNIGAQSIYTLRPALSPDGKLIAYGDSTEMTQEERDLKHEDVWIANQDGTNKVNITKASIPSTERRLNFIRFVWSWDSKLILSRGNRYDKLGNSISSLFMVDPFNYTYETIFTSNPKETGINDDLNAAKWSYDNSKIAILKIREEVQNWGVDTSVTNKYWTVCLYLVKEKKNIDLLIFDQELDRKVIPGYINRQMIEGFSWSPDNRSLLITIADVISAEDGQIKPDIYRLDLPSELISPDADKYVGPSNLRDSAGYDVPTKTIADKNEQVSPSQNANGYQIYNSSFVTEIIEPMHMTVDEAIESLPSLYDQYITLNTSRNIILFKGPIEILNEMKSDLDLVDTDPPHILVDLLAVELSEEANRNLGLDWSYAEGHFALYQPSGKNIQKQPSSSDFPGFPAGALDTLAFLPGVGQNFYQGVGNLPREFYIRLNTLVKDGEGTILANPRTVAMSGKESLIRIRKTLNYFFNEGFDTSGRPVVKKSDISADTEGRITPTLLADGRIHLVVDVGVGSFTFTQDAGLPEQTIRESTTEVIVEQGQTIVIGGLRQQETNKTITKVPLLGDLPLLGGLFRNEEEQVKNSVLTIFITPQLLKPDEVEHEWIQLDPNDHKIVPIMKNKLSPTNGNYKR